MTVVSNPPGATVFLDGKELGRTPFTTNFDHYGKQEFRLVMQGYETKTELVPVRAPWFQWVGLDFIAEVLLPGKLTDHKLYEFDMQPAQIVSGSDVISRAEQFRQTAHADGVLRVGGSTISASPAPVGSIAPPVHDFAPIMPPPPLPIPQNMPTDPSTFVPPAF